MSFFNDTFFEKKREQASTPFPQRVTRHALILHRVDTFAQWPRRIELRADSARGRAGDAVPRPFPRTDPATGLAARLQARGGRHQVPAGQSRHPSARFRPNAGRDPRAHAACRFEVGVRPVRWKGFANQGAPVSWFWGWLATRVRRSHHDEAARWLDGTSWLRGWPTAWFRCSHNDRGGGGAADAGGQRS